MSTILRPLKPTVDALSTHFFKSRVLYSIIGFNQDWFMILQVHTVFTAKFGPSVIEVLKGKILP